MTRRRIYQHRLKNICKAKSRERVINVVYAFVLFICIWYQISSNVDAHFWLVI